MNNEEAFVEFKRVEKKKKSIRINERGWNIIALIVMALIVNVVTIIYSCVSEDIYYWSTAESWNIAIKIADGAYKPNLWGEVYNSIINLDFNFLSSLLPALFIKIFGQTRLVYLISLANCYIVSAQIAIYFLAKKIGKAPLVTMFLSMLIIPASFYMMIRGFSEISGLFISIICINLYFTNKKEKSILRAVIIGLLLALLVLISNVYLFFSISFATAMVAESIILKKKIHKSVISILAMVIILLVFFRDYITGRIIALYGNGSFDFNFILNTKFLVRYFGLIFTLLLMGASIYITISKQERKTVFLWLELFICYIMLTATKMHGQLHILLYLPSIIALFVLCVKYIEKEKVLIGVVALSLCQSASVFIKREQPQNVEDIKYYSPLPSFSLRAPVRNSSDDVLSLKYMLDNLVGEGEYLGVLSYSNSMNADMLNNVELSLNKKQYRRNYIAFTIPCFDNINPDISPLCNANYMLVPTKFQTIADNQNILVTATESFWRWENIARAYEELYEYETYIDGVSYKVFRRVRNVTDTEKRQFIEALNEKLNNN